MIPDELPPAVIRFRVFGIPGTAGNKTAFPIKTKDGGMRVVVREGKKAGPAQVWRGAVMEAVQEAARAGAPLLDAPLILGVTFYVPRPASAPRAQRWPDRRPDLSKYLRAIEDPMIGVLISDDSRIVEAHLAKRYATEADRPGADVALWYADTRLAMANGSGAVEPPGVAASHPPNAPDVTESEPARHGHGSDATPHVASLHSAEVAEL